MSGDFNPFSLEDHAAFAAVGRNISRSRRKRREQMLGKEIARLELLEARMRRAFRAWDAQRTRVGRLEKLADKEVLG